MPNNYVYRMDHDTGFAPNTRLGICTLTGCKNSKTGKTRNIEELAEPGSWVIGIGGNGTKRPDKLIYVMEVEKNLQIDQFLIEYPDKSKYLRGRKPGTNVLISRKFFYFGNNAITVPPALKRIIIDRQGFWKVRPEEIRILQSLLSNEYGDYGVYGTPNNKETNAIQEKLEMG